MVCIYCGGDTRVSNSRFQKKLNQIWRRRLCMDCGAVYTTEERPLTDNSLLVVDGKRSEPFSREILFLSLYDSLKHRKTAIADAVALTDTIWGKLAPGIVDASIQSKDIIRTSLVVLHNFDKAAATSYRAFHPLTDS